MGGFDPCNIFKLMTPPYESKLLGVTNYYSWHMREKPIFMCYRLPQWLVLHVSPGGGFFYAQNRIKSEKSETLFLFRNFDAEN